MRLTVGTPAPEFEAKDFEGAPIRLSDYRGRMVWLSFYRYASCPLCNLRIHEVIERWAGFEAAGLSVLAVFQSTPEGIARYVGKQAAPFSLIADPDEALYRLYHLEASTAALLSPANAVPFAKAMSMGFAPGKAEGTKTRIPADFLIAPDQRLADVYYGGVISDHIPFERVDAFTGAERRA